MIQEILLPFVFDGLVKLKDWVMIVGIKLAKLGHVFHGKIEFSEN